MHPSQPRTVTLCLIALALFAVPARAQTALKWKFKKGDKFGYAMEQQLVTKATFSGQNLTATMRQSFDTSWAVNDVVDGKADLTETIDRIRVSLDQGGQKMEYDSKDGKLPEGPAGQVFGPFFAAMGGSKMSFKMSPEGEISEVKLPEKITDVLRNSPGGAALGMFNEDSLKQMFTQSTLLLPAKPVSKGSTWNKEVVIENAGLKMRLNNVFTYDGPTTQNGQVDQVGVKIETKLELPQNAPQVMIKSQDSSGKFLFDNQKGRLNESSLVQKMEIGIMMMDKEYVSTTETTATMKLVPSASN
jgi:hypothetical protein